MSMNGVLEVAEACNNHFTDARSAAVSTRWYVAVVKSRHEFVAYNDLRSKDIMTFLPSVKRVRQWKDRKKTIEYPLFPGYIFVSVADRPGAFVDVLKARGIVNFICLEAGMPTPVPSDEIHSLRLLIESGSEIDVYPELKVGARIRIKNGPLADAEGVLSRRENEFVLLVNIELLGRSVAVRITPHDVEAA